MKLLAGIRAGFVGWLRQPTTIHGIGTLLGLGAAAAVHVASGDTTATVAAFGLLYAAPHLLINDSTASSEVEQLLQAAIQARLGAAEADAIARAGATSTKSAGP